VYERGLQINNEAMLAPFVCVAPAFQHEPSWLTLRRIPPHDVAMKSAVHAMRPCFQICSPVAAHKKKLHLRCGYAFWRQKTIERAIQQCATSR
jgi:hypothetical protein